MSHSIRLIFRNMQGRVRMNHNWAAINQRSAVLVTSAEWKQVTTADPVDAEGRPHLGDANVYVTNIGPHGQPGEAGGVEFYLHVDSKRPLHVQVTITVLDVIEHWQVVG